MGRNRRVTLLLKWIKHSKSIYEILAYYLLKWSGTLHSQTILTICLIVNLMQMELGTTCTLCPEIGHGNRQYVLIFSGKDL